MRHPWNAIAAFGALLLIGQEIAADEKPTLKQIINNVEANEALYNRIELSFEYKYRFVMPIKPSPKGAQIQSYRDRIRLVHVDEKFYFESKRISFFDEDEERSIRSTTQAAFDGRQTRVIHTGPKQSYGALHHSRHLFSEMLQPNSLLINRWISPQPLSRLLRTPDTRDSHYRWRVDGYETIDGLKCVKLKFQHVDAFSGEIWNDATFWLAVDRNYQPAKIVALTPRFSTKLAHSVSRVAKFKEIRRGVWLPAETESIGYDAEALTRTGKQRVGSRRSVTLRDVKLKPKLDDSLLQSVKFPKGASIAEYRDGNEIRSYRQK